MTKSTQNILDLEPQLMQSLEKAAAELRCCPNALVNEAVRSFIEVYERIQQLRAKYAKQQSLLTMKKIILIPIYS